MTRTYDTIVVGAGIAGLNAGRFLTQKSILLDRKAEIGKPVRCGEGISLSALEREGLVPEADWIKSRIRQIKRIMPNGKHWGEKKDNAYAYVVDRQKFEKYLAGLIPWEIRLDTRIAAMARRGDSWVLTSSTGEVFSARNVIAADGPLSLAARKIFGYRYDLLTALNYEIGFDRPLATEELHMYFGNRLAPKGYAWVFPTSLKRANVGMLIRTDASIKKCFDDFLESQLRPLYGPYQLGIQKSGPIPICGFPVITVKDRLFLAGDAGAFSDPIFCGGMNMALLTGRLAAESINDDDPVKYRTAVDSLPFDGKDLKTAAGIFYGFGDQTLNQLGELLQGHSSSYVMTEAGQAEFGSLPELVSHKSEIAVFAKTWQAAKAYLW